MSPNKEEGGLSGGFAWQGHGSTLQVSMDRAETIT
jgi:hypothetical protein